jgi:uncharacterized damage-inducible protein DinB
VPTTRTSLLSALATTHQDIAQRFADLPVDEFFAPQYKAATESAPGELAWSPAQHLGHLCLSVAAVARALSLPKLVLVLRFGPSLRTSRDFEAVRAMYGDALGRGGKASARFLPEESTDDAKAASADAQAQLVARWRRVGDRLQAAAGSWNDLWLDRCRLPHPLLGKLSCREMLYFTLYHGVHHARRVDERRSS